MSAGRVEIGTSGIYLAYGIQDLVAADGSAASTITFSEAFSSEVLTNPILGMDGGTLPSIASVLTVESFDTTISGFKVLVAGGAPSTTVTVSYMILGE